MHVTSYFATRVYYRHRIKLLSAKQQPLNADRPYISNIGCFTFLCAYLANWQLYLCCHKNACPVNSVIAERCNSIAKFNYSYGVLSLCLSVMRVYCDKTTEAMRSSVVH